MSSENPFTKEQIRYQNGNVLNKAIMELTDKMVLSVNFGNPNLQFEEIPIQLLDQSGHEIACMLEGSFFAILSQPGKYRLQLTLYRSFMDENGKEVSETMSELHWDIQLDIFELQVESHIRTASKYEGIGIGKTMIHSGEVFKNRFTNDFAISRNKQRIRSIIVDGSDTNWTSSQAREIGDYTETKAGYFEKIENVIRGKK